MMNILLDFLTVRWKNGGGEWTRRVYLELFNYLLKYPSAVRTCLHFMTLLMAWHMKICKRMFSINVFL